MMKYKGYIGQVEYDSDAKLFHGEVLGMRDVITFQGKTVNELEKAFKDSINDYLAWCKERGEKPEKTFSGKFNVRISSDLHAKLSSVAQSKGKSLNAVVSELLQQACSRY